MIDDRTSPANQAAFLSALAGGAVAQAMTLGRGGMANDLLPDAVLCVLGALGAGAAGLAASGAFGHPGWRGWLLATIAWPLTTLLGAYLAALPFGGIFGIIAVGEALATSWHVRVSWLAGGVAVHTAMCQERRAIDRTCGPT